MFRIGPRPILIVLTGLALVATGCGGREPHTIPDVTGERLDVAQELLDEAGVGYETVGGGFFGAIVRSRWEVCRQSPLAGAVATEVQLVVARDCPPVVVPALRGLQLDRALRELGERGIPAGRVQAASVEGTRLDAAEAADWRVCRSDPPAASELYSETEITLIAASRCPPAVLPDLSGLRLDLALRRLGPLGRTAEIVSALGAPPHGVAARGWLVCGQQPAAGSELVLGSLASVVTLSIARGCAVPDLVGLRLGRARAMLARLGMGGAAFELDRRALDPVRDVVCAQGPLPGEPASSDGSAAVVSLSVARRCPSLR